MQTTSSQQDKHMDGVTPVAIPTLALMSGLGSHVWLGSLLASAPWLERPDTHGEQVVLEAVLEDGSHVGSWAFPYEKRGAGLKSSSLQEALQAL